MAQQNINIGAAPNDNTGDPPRTAAAKINSNFSEVYTAVGTMAPLANAALTGTPTAPTPTLTDNTTKLATTAFVKGQGYLTTAPVISVAGQTGVVTLAAGDLTATGTKNATTFLRGDNTWAVPAGGGGSAAISYTANVMRDFGAIFDGASHPLSQRYGTLAAAKVVYPHATALTQEIDWAALQGAINSVEARGDRGGVVEIPNAGIGKFNETVTMNPRRTSIWGEGTILDFSGIGYTNKPGFLCRCDTGSRYGHSKHWMSGLEIVGPGQNGAQLGTTAFLFDTTVDFQSTRQALEHMTIKSWPRAFNYANRCYLVKTHDVDIYDCTEGLYFGTGLADAGENYTYNQGAIYNCGTAIRNIGGAGIQFIGTSLDYNGVISSGSWGEMHFIGCHLEHASKSTWQIEQNGNCSTFVGCWYFVNGTNTAAAFKTATGATIIWEGGRARGLGSSPHQGTGTFLKGSYTTLAGGGASDNIFGAA